MKTKLRILFIEDSPDDVLLISRELARANYEVSFDRVDTEPALKQALAREPWDAILCDFTMPRFSGRNALRVVRDAASDLPFIYVSGTIGEDVAVEAVKSGAQDYVMKSNLKRLPAAMDRELREAALRRLQRATEKDRDQVIAELQAELDAFRSLSGEMPICAHCLRACSADGSWQTLESLFQAHTTLRFSRSLCPECQRTGKTSTLRQ